MSQAQAQQPAFDLIIEGLGYLNRVRDVEVRKGPSYLACTINAMMGTGDDVEYVSIDCRVVGRQAKEVVEQLRRDVDAKAKVIIGFRAGDPKPDVYTVERDGKTEQRQGLKARLLQVMWAKVNGTRVTIPLVERKVSAHSDDPGSAAEASSRESLAEA